VRRRTEISAGGVIYRRRRGETEVCLILTQGGRAWQLPKGIIEPGEPAEEAARREIAEETGLEGTLVQPLDIVTYQYRSVYDPEPARVSKWVHFFLFRYRRGSTRNHDDEVDDARWFPLAEAQSLITFENERRMLELAAKALGADGAAAPRAPRPTSPMRR